MFPEPDFAELDVAAIRANPRQPRQVFDEDALGELTHSIREFGVLQPVVVRPAGSDGGYELVMGERRLRAAIAAGLARIPAIVRDTADDAMLRDALLENLHRTSLNPLEEAAAYQQLLEEFGVTHEELALRIGRSRSQVSNTIRLMNLSIPVQRRVAAGVISAGHARALLALADRDAQDELAGRIVAEGLSVRATEEIVATAATRGGPRGPAGATSGARTGSRPRDSMSSPIGFPTCSTPGCGSTSAGARARSRSSLPRSTTWSASSESWLRSSRCTARRRPTTSMGPTSGPSARPRSGRTGRPTG